MTLQSATEAKSISDLALIQAKAIISSLIMNVINTEITRLSTKITEDVRTFKADIQLEAILNDDKNKIEIIQSDLTRVFLIDIESALVDAGYRVSSRSINSSRAGVNDRVKMQVAWG